MGFNLESGYGKLMATAVAVAGPTFGKILVVCPESDPNYNRLSQIIKYDPEGAARLYTTVEAAYAAMTTSGNDVCFLSANATHAVATGLPVTKNRCHFVGMDFGGRLEQQGSKIELTGAVDSAYVLKVTGNRNTFKNIKFIQSSTHANALTVVQLAGEGTVMENCSGVFGVANNLGSTSASELVLNEDSGTIKDCAFGSSVILTSAARAVCSIARVSGSASSDGMKNTSVIDCTFKIMSSSASATLIKVANANAVKFENVIVRPTLIAAICASNVAVTLDNAIASVSGLVEGNILVTFPASNCTKVCAGVTDNVKVSGPAPSATTGIGATPA